MLLDRLETLPWVIGATLLAFAFLLLSTSCIILVRRTASQKTLKAYHDVSGFVFAYIGVLYSVLLGFTVVNAQERFSKIKETTQIEAGYLSNLFEDAHNFSEHDKNAVRSALINYAYSVIYNEWPDMQNDKSNPQTVAALRGIWTSYYAVNATDVKQQTWYTESINNLNSLMSTRLARLMGGRESLGSEMWTFLLLGGIIVITFICFFSMESLILQIVMAAVVAFSTAFLLFLIYSLDTAFSGNVSIPPEAFERVLATFKVLS